MAKIRPRPESGHLYFDFVYQGRRCREQTTLEDSSVNRRRMQQVLDKICAEITLGSFQYEAYFPSSRLAQQFVAEAPSTTSLAATHRIDDSPSIREFAETMFVEQAVGWRHNTKLWMRSLYDTHLLPDLGDCPVSSLRREDVLQFRVRLAKKRSGSGRPLSAKTINVVMRVLNAMMAEAADRYRFENPAVRIKRLKVQKRDIAPFTLVEVQKILSTVRSDFRTYLLVRFFCGLRSGEVDGLKWRHVDLERRQIVVRETYTHGRTEYTKTDGSQREIDLSQIVYDALVEHRKHRTTESEYVFCTAAGTPIDAKNFADRVWHPLLRYLELERRRPYETRYTCATLWLAAGENPEWIAKQLGHTTTEMLFRVYSRYVPNLTRRDGSAFDRMIAESMTRSLAA